MRRMPIVTHVTEKVGYLLGSNPIIAIPLMLSISYASIEVVTYQLTFLIYKR